MTFGHAVFFGLVGVYGVFFIVGFWADKLKINLSCSVVLISIPLIWAAITAFILLALPEIVTIAMYIGIALIFLTLIAALIFELIEKWRH